MGEQRTLLVPENIKREDPINYTFTIPACQCKDIHECRTAAMAGRVLLICNSCNGCCAAVDPANLKVKHDE